MLTGGSALTSTHQIIQLQTFIEIRFNYVFDHTILLPDIILGIYACDVDLCQINKPTGFRILYTILAWCRASFAWPGQLLF